jgi:hypothetical protein
LDRTHGCQWPLCFAGHPDHLIWSHAIFSYGGTLRTLSLYRPCHWICLRCEDESSLPSQESIVRCCGGKWAEMDYRLVVCRVTKGGHIEHLWGICRVSLSIGMSHVTILCAIQVYQFFVTCLGI